VELDTYQSSLLELDSWDLFSEAFDSKHDIANEICKEVYDEKQYMDFDNDNNAEAVDWVDHEVTVR